MYTILQTITRQVNGVVARSCRIQYLRLVTLIQLNHQSFRGAKRNHVVVFHS